MNANQWLPGIGSGRKELTGMGHKELLIVGHVL